MTQKETAMSLPRIASREEWLAARTDLLAKEKDLTRRRDALNIERRNLPMVEIDKDYRFDGPDGEVGLRDMFGDRAQLVVYHFMFDPDWDEGCPSCTAGTDELSPGFLKHLAIRDTSYAMVSRAPLAKLEAWKAKRGWDLPWYSSYGTDFNYDFGVSFTPEQVAKGVLGYNYGTLPAKEEWPGVSAFYRDDSGDVFHTYSTYGRGVEVMMGTYNMLDLVPKGRDERDVPHKMEWVRHHDRYEQSPAVTPAAAHSCHDKGA